MTKLIYICHIINGENDGGMARNRAFYNYFSNRNSEIYNLYNKNIGIRILNLAIFIFHFFYFKDKKILIHLGTIFTIFPKAILRTKIGLYCFYQFFKRLSKKNILYLEVNDLPYEQAIDLNLKVENFYLKLQDVIFDKNLSVSYVFASHEMAKYILKKYSINSSKSQVIINGAPKMEKRRDNNKILKSYQSFDLKYIYVGTLNEGRGIDELIILFQNLNSYLFLVGVGGEWLNERLKNINNIIYLGSFDEQQAMEITSECDFGIMHYDSSKFYYNLCYPTKNSFYISAGINVVSTKLVESQNVISKYNIFLFEDFNKWKKIIDNPLQYFEDLDEINEYIKGQFYWNNILENLKI
ncbi:hypothetical protein [Chryseobacterium rhizosphaerae]|uniref:hypothetical protein n=1 Tax=Chryseobacterium rhizosphaerae TaxID=395937 RepID=UPI0023598421|nr:hypothetical protein [Chryseobacterium rhizosphaerae]MDC8098920.1 hypothetical protein [Chryseobacterium rhizosphaerae]